MQKVLKEELLRKAIQGEKQASNFYSKVKEMIINKNSRNLMESLANEEIKHSETLERRYKDLFNKDFEEIPGFIFDKNLDIKKLGLSSQSDAIQILSSAIEAENNAIKFYSDLLKETDSIEDVEILKSLIKFEESHKTRLQDEYNSVNKNYIWQIP